MKMNLILQITFGDLLAGFNQQRHPEIDNISSSSRCDLFVSSKRVGNDLFLHNTYIKQCKDCSIFAL